jgi:hypothetical protein
MIRTKAFWRKIAKIIDRCADVDLAGVLIADAIWEVDHWHGQPDTIEWRCTRNDPYTHDCLGHEDIGSRQGHYVYARDRAHALRQMMREFPHDTHGFTADESKRWDTEGRQC